MRIVLKGTDGSELDGWSSIEHLAVEIIRGNAVFEEGDRIEFLPDLDLDDTVEECEIEETEEAPAPTAA